MHERTNLVLNTYYIYIGHHWQESTTTTTNHSLYWHYQLHCMLGTTEQWVEQWNCKPTFTQCGCLSLELLMTGKLTISLKCWGQCPVRGLLSRHVTLSSQSHQYKLFLCFGEIRGKSGEKGGWPITMRYPYTWVL